MTAAVVVGPRLQRVYGVRKMVVGSGARSVAAVVGAVLEEASRSDRQTACVTALFPFSPRLLDACAPFLRSCVAVVPAREVCMFFLIPALRFFCGTFLLVALAPALQPQLRLLVEPSPRLFPTANADPETAWVCFWVAREAMAYASHRRGALDFPIRAQDLAFRVGKPVVSV